MKLSLRYCPACHKPLAKKYLRSLSPLEWQKLQTAHWMEAWHRELGANIRRLKIKPMKKTLVGIAAAFALAGSASGATLWETFQAFLDQAPTNSWDVSAYAVKLNSSGNGAGVKAYGLGGGLALSYAVTPVLGAKLSADWCDSSWTFASLGMTARGTIHFGTALSVTPYAGVGPGWNVRGTGQTLVAVAETGATVDIKGLPVKLFGAYQLITATPNQQRFLVGLTYPF